MDKKAKLINLAILIVLSMFLIITKSANAQMMVYPSSSPSNISNSDIQGQQQEEQEGKNLFDKLNNKQVSCAQLSNSDFEKIGEYFMGQYINNTSNHIQMNNSMQSMMGTQGEEQMHISLGKQRGGCETTASFPNMMGSYGFGLIATLFWLISFIDLILLGVWLWKQIQKK